MGDGGVGGESRCFGEQRVGPRQPSWVGGTAVNEGGGRGLDPLLVVFCVGGLPPAQPEIYSYALIVDAPVKHTAENGNMQV